MNHKNLLFKLGTGIAFITVLSFSYSCKKEAVAQQPPQVPVPRQVNKILFEGPTKNELYTANYDGTGKQRINYTFPAAAHVDNSLDDAQLSPDGQTVFLRLYFGRENTIRIYSCNIDGTNMKIVLDDNETYSDDFFGAY